MTKWNRIRILKILFILSKVRNIREQRCWGGDTEGKTAKGSGERVRKRASFKSAVHKIHSCEFVQFVSKNKSAGRISPPGAGFFGGRAVSSVTSQLPVNHDAAASNILGIRVVNVVGRTQHIVIYHREANLVPYLDSELIDATSAVDLAVSRGQ